MLRRSMLASYVLGAMPGTIGFRTIPRGKQHTFLLMIYARSARSDIPEAVSRSRMARAIAAEPGVSE